MEMRGLFARSGNVRLYMRKTTRIGLPVEDRAPDFARIDEDLVCVDCGVDKPATEPALSSSESSRTIFLLP